MATDILPILDELSNLLSQDTIDMALYPQFQKYYQEIDNLYNKLQYLQISKTIENKTSYMKQAYAVIMQFRKFFLNEEIIYRLYIRTSDSITDFQIADIDEKTLLKMVGRDNDTLVLYNWTQKALQLERTTRVEEIINHHINNIINSIKHIKTNNYVVPFDNIRDVIHSRVGVSNLYWQIKNNGPGKSRYSPKMFNRGWIYQALDATVEELYGKKTIEDYQVPTSEFRQAFFKKHLVYDKVVGFKGGDVGLKQIKSNGAQLISLTTLINYLQNIKIILEKFLFFKNASKAEIKELIYSFFINQENVIDQTIDANISQRIDQLLENFIQMSS